MPTFAAPKLATSSLYCLFLLGSLAANAATPESVTPIAVTPESVTPEPAAPRAATASSATISTPLPTFSVSYTLQNDYITGGEAKFRLTKKENHYQLLLETKPTGVFRLSKKGKIREIAELPSLSPPFLSNKYSYTNYGDKSRSYTSVYNREIAEATTIRGGNTTRTPIDANAVDRLSMTLTLMQLLRDQPEATSFSIDTIDATSAQANSFVSRGQETLKTGIGTLTATRIDRQRSNSNRNTITWFAAIGPDNLPVPVQIEHYKRGKMTVRLKITDFSAI